MKFEDKILKMRPATLATEHKERLRCFRIPKPTIPNNVSEEEKARIKVFLKALEEQRKNKS